MAMPLQISVPLNTTRRIVNVAYMMCTHTNPLDSTPMVPVSMIDLDAIIDADDQILVLTPIERQMRKTGFLSFSRVTPLEMLPKLRFASS